MNFKKLYTFFIVTFLIFPIYGAKIIVIGAGLAGLTAGHRLKEKGHQVEIYEAGKRPGGRVFTCYFTDGTYNELGGINIHDGDQGDRLKTLADELGVSYYSFTVQRDFSYCTDDGQLIDLKEIFKDAPAPSDTLQIILKQNNSIAQALGTLIPSNNPLLKNFLDIRTRGYEGCDCKNLSMYYFESLWEYYCYNYHELSQGQLSSYDFCTIKNGMCNLIDALCKSLEGCIHYEMPLTHISKNNASFIFKIGDKKITADKIILALPFSTLHDVIIDEDIIPNDQMNFINTLQYGTNAKLLIPTSGKSLRLCGAINDCLMMKEESVLWLYFGGSYGIFENHTNALTGLMKKYVPAIKTLYPELDFNTEITSVPETTQSFVKVNNPVGISWVNEPYSKGSYSCLAPGQEVLYENFSDYCGIKIRNIFRPITDTIFFAGEHTSIENPSTMEGAVESGERAAKMVIHSLNKEK